MPLQVYLDNATTTKVDERVLESMTQLFLEDYGAPTTEYGHSFGVKALEALRASQETVAGELGVLPEEVVFTSGGVEANNMAILGTCLQRGKGKIVTTKIEHSSVVDAIQALGKSGFEVHTIGVNQDGLIDPEDLDAAVDDETILVAVGHGNGEIGTVQDVEAISSVCNSRGVPLHLDARASFLWEKLDLKKVDASTVSTTAHTIHGPKGIGALIKRKGFKLSPIIPGPGTEFNLRPGTVNLPGAVAMARAIEIWDPEDVERVRGLSKHLWGRIKGEVPDTEINGPEVGRRLANNLNCNFMFIEGESILLYLDMAGIAVSTGSACSSKNLRPSYVLSAIGIPPEKSHGSIRFSLSRFNKKEEIDYAGQKVVEVVNRLREMSSMG
jgi:cysteine desulfurase